MAYKVNSLEEMPNALSYLIESVEALQSKVNALQHKQASNSPKWMDIDELCAYLPSHPAKQTVYVCAGCTGGKDQSVGACQTVPQLL